LAKTKRFYGKWFKIYQVQNVVQFIPDHRVFRPQCSTTARPRVLTTESSNGRSGVELQSNCSPIPHNQYRYKGEINSKLHTVRATAEI